MKQSDEQTQFRVVALVGSDSAATRNTLEALCVVDGVEIAAVVLECGAVGKGRRWKNFRRNVKREGWSYPIWRVLGAVSEWLEARSAAPADRGQVERWMGEAFAGENFRLDQWALSRGVALHRLENLNSAECGGLLEGLGADLGIVIGTRILKRSTFAKPRLGSLNLHKGKVPEYRGMPPGFLGDL